MTVLNIAAYRFVRLAEPAAWIHALRERADALRLKGTIIVASEGINLSLAGDAASIEAFLGWLAADPRFVDRDGRPAFADLAVKRSESEGMPFRRLRIKHRPEIVTMRRPAVRPEAGRAPAIDAERLAKWLEQGHDDDGHPIKLLDTRNAFEVERGTFAGAIHLDLARFEAFPDAVDALRAGGGVGDATIVTFCTGGIRCEKAALYMQQSGFPRVLQLDGGILEYFDRVGDDHWRGDCFVFDDREALAADLAPAG